MVLPSYIRSAAVIVCAGALVCCTISCKSSAVEVKPQSGYIQIYKQPPKGINYRVLGIVDAHLVKSTFENEQWWRTQIEGRLRKKAKAMGADALINARFDSMAGNASAQAIKYREVFPLNEEA